VALPRHEPFPNPEENEMTSPITGVPNSTSGAVGTIDPATAPAASAVNSSGDNNDLLNPQAFLQLLVAQLQYQDPTNPVNASDFMNQTATLSEVQTMNSMSSTLTALSSAQNAQEATSMIGKQVTYTNAAGLLASGVVSSTELLPSGPTLQVGNDTVALTSVSKVSAAPSTS
jgi:flagellar basal-body rod modification protein FlgD